MKKVRKDLGLSKKNLGFTAIMEKAKKKWKTLPRQIKVVIALMSFLKMDFEKLNKIKIEDIDMPNKNYSIGILVIHNQSQLIWILRVCITNN